METSKRGVARTQVTCRKWSRKGSTGEKWSGVRGYDGARKRVGKGTRKRSQRAKKRKLRDGMIRSGTTRHLQPEKQIGGYCTGKVWSIDCWEGIGKKKELLIGRLLAESCRWEQ